MKITIGARNIANLASNTVPIVSIVIFFYRRAFSVILLWLFNIPSSVSIGVISGICVFLCIIWAINNHEIRIRRSLWILVFMFGLYMISLLITPNELAESYFREFLLYCVVGAVIISFVEDYEKMIQVYCHFSILVFILCAPLPFITGTIHYHNMGFFGSGMVYGEWVILPAFFGIYMLRRIKKSLVLFILELIDLALMVLFTNRSSIISVAVFILLYDILIAGQHNKRYILKWIILLAIAFVIYFYITDILMFIQNYVFLFLGIKSRALTKYILYFNADELNLSYFVSGRDTISNFAFEIIKSNPHFGIGIGTFFYETGVVYTHNFLTDALVTFGFVGGIIIVLITLKAVLNLFLVNNKSLQLVLLLLVLLCFPRLFFSKTFVNDVPYWMFMVFSLSKGKYIKRKQQFSVNQINKVIV